MADSEKTGAISRGILSMAVFMDAHAALVGVAALDESLEGALLTKMRPLNSAMKRRIFDQGGNAPLANFASKIDMAYALGVIPDEMYNALRLINKFRVKFAHVRRITHFADPSISLFLRELNLDMTIPISATRYLARLKVIDDYLRTVTAPEHLAPEIEDSEQKSIR